MIDAFFYILWGIMTYPVLARADQGSVKALCQYRLAMGSVEVVTRQL